MATAATRAERDQRIERVDAIRRSLRQGVSTDKRAVEVESKAVRWTEWLRRRLKALGGGDPVRLLPDAIAEVEQHAAEDLQAVTLVQPEQQWAEMGNLLGQKRRKVGRLQRQAARCFLVTQEASSVELGTWCWPRVVLIEKRPLTESERSSMNRAARSFGARRIRRLGRNNWIWRLSDDVAARWR